MATLTRRLGKQGFTLAEIVASIALIAVVGVFLVQMFAISDGLAAKARSLDRAIALSASVADRWKAGTGPDALGDIPEIAGVLPGGSNWSYLPVDKLMKACPEADADYIVELVVTESDNGVYDLRIRVIETVNGWKTEQSADSHVLHQLHASRYFR